MCKNNKNNKKSTVHLKECVMLDMCTYEKDPQALDG